MRNDNLKVVMIGQKRIPSREGGIEIVVEEISKRLVLDGFDVTCLNRKGNHVAGKKYNSNSMNKYKGIKLIGVPTIDKKGLAAITSSFFASIKASFGSYEIVHFHAEGPSIMCWLPKLFGKKVIVTIHGLDWKREKWGKLASNIIKYGEKNAVKYANEIIVLNKSESEYFRKEYNRDTIIIPNGVNILPRLSVNLIKERWNLNKDEYILFVGRIVPEKGIHYLIEAYNSLEINKKLVIAGGASDSSIYFDKLKKMSEFNNNIIFTNFVSGDILTELFSNAYIYVLPSDLEGMPLSLLEAMSFGNCCLTSDINACRETILNNGIYFTHGDINDLKKKIQYLCNNNTIVEEYRKKSILYIKRNFNWNEIVKKIEDVYKRNELV